MVTSIALTLSSRQWRQASDMVCLGGPDSQMAVRYHSASVPVWETGISRLWA